MGEPVKPFSCPESGCGASFTNEDRLAVHSKKHDMNLQLGIKGGGFIADQTPTPTRFMRNCEEVGIFEDLQNANIFEEAFKTAMEKRTGVSHQLISENQLSTSTITTATDDTLHTPHIFPNLTEESANIHYICKNVENNSVPNTLPIENNMNQFSIHKNFVPDLERNISLSNLHEKDFYNTDHEIVIDKCKYKSNSKQTPKLKLIKPNFVSCAIDSPMINRNLTSLSNVLSEKVTPLINVKLSGNMGKNGDVTKNIPIISITNSEKRSDSNMKIEICDSQGNLSASNSSMNNLKNIPEGNSYNFNDCENNSVNNKVSCTLKRKQTFSEEKMNKSSLVVSNHPDECIEVTNEENKLYELVLKCPNGKKIFLREVYEQNIHKVENNECQISASVDSYNSLNDIKIQNNVKQRLKESIQNNSKKCINSPIGTCESVIPVIINPTVNDQIKAIITPVQNVKTVAIWQAPTNTLGEKSLSSNVKYSNISPKINPIQSNNLQKRVVTTIIKPTNIVKPITNKKDVSAKNKLPLGKSASRKSNNGICVLPNTVMDEKKKKERDIQERNRAAVSRYRENKKKINKMIIQQNKKLEEENKILNDKLNCAFLEIRRLKEMLNTHNECTVMKAVQEFLQKTKIEANMKHK